MRGESNSNGSWLSERMDNKRRREEETWTGTRRQPKRFKYGQVLANVYATTLTKLRTGARNFFQPAASASAPALALTNTLERMDISSEDLRDTEGSSATSTNQAQPGRSSSVIPHLVSQTNSSTTTPSIQPAQGIIPNMCESCCRNNLRNPAMSNRQFEKCYFCEKGVCHLNQCASCGSGFCGNCSLHKYEEDFTEVFVCISCFH